jgi:hypothetical protein
MNKKIKHILGQINATSTFDYINCQRTKEAKDLSIWEMNICNEIQDKKV